MQRCVVICTILEALNPHAYPPIQATPETPSLPKPPCCLKVALPLPLPGLFDYVPEDGSTVDQDWIGCRVRVPFGARELVGWVSAIGVTETLPEALKPILQRLDRTPVMTAELLQTLRWTAQYYQAPFGEVLSTAVPALLREGKAPPDVCVYAWQLTAEGQAGIDSLRRTGKPQALAMRLRTGALPEALLDSDTPGWRGSMRSLQARAWVERIALNRSEMAGTKPEEEGPALNADQAACVQALKASAGFGVHLIEGVTGSGKTEIYIQAVRDCLARGRQAMVLVPEIGLTPQTLARFRARLPAPVHVLHSNLSDGDRAQAWTAMAEGIGRVLLGTRSAVFTPMPEAGLVIVDEEHDSSYKQQDGFHYHARDVAVLRAKSLNVPVLLGSATPSLESWHNTDVGRYQRHRLPERAGAAKPPTVRITDIRKIRLQHGLSQSMLDGIAACLNDGGQALVFKNRRGYAPALLCHDCGFTAQCPRCDTALTLHAGQRRLHCHHCGHQKPKPPACPDCGSLALQPQGFGTERLEEALTAAFPEFPCIRVDSGTTRRRDGLAGQLSEIGDGAGILVGTQILAKGHDLPNLRFVGVVGVDESLFSSDFRAHEKLSQLLIQVAGRAGRADKPGQVLSQTHHPDHPLLADLLAGGYPEFARKALEERRLADLPPFTHMALLRAESVHSEAARHFLEEVTALVDARRRELKLAVHSSGVLPAGMPRRAGRYRWQLVLNAIQRSGLQSLLAAVHDDVHALKSSRKVRWSFDVDPSDFL